MVTIDKFIDFFTEKIRKEENVSLVRNFASKGEWQKPKAKIFLNKMRPAGGLEISLFINKMVKGTSFRSPPNFQYKKDSAFFVKDMGTTTADFVK